MNSRDHKVVALNRNKASRSSRLGSAESACIKELEKRGRTKLMGLLQNLFDQADDALFEFADKSDNTIQQDLYFESMRELRIQRRGIENSFSREITEAFRQLLRDPKASAKSRASVAKLSEDSLSMVEEDELEEMVALESMVSKAMSASPAALSQLTVRITELFGFKVDTKRNPLGPQVICRAFVESCQHLKVDIKAKLLVFKLFDRFVLSELDSVFELANRFLIDQGVLPNLTGHALQQRRQRTRTSAPEMDNSTKDAGYAGEADTLENEVFAGLQRLLNHHVPPASVQMARYHAGGLVPVGQGPVLGHATMMDLLSQIQQQQGGHLQQLLNAGGRYISAQPAQLDVITLLDQLLAQDGSTRPHSIGKADHDVIDLVQMLFQFILDDGNLADEMKSLISRMQVPMLKVAMEDKSFFSKGGHPARKLLNEVATAALGWVPLDEHLRDPLYDKIEAVVEHMLNRYDEDLDIIQELLADFVSFMESETRKANLVEQRTVDAEDGRARTELARAEVQRVVDSRLVGLEVPEVVVSLVRNAWSNVLFLTYLKEGPDSEAWQHAIAVLEELLWSVQAIDTAEARRALLDRVPDLLKNLREGLTQISYNPFDMNQLFTQLEGEHLKRLKGNIGNKAQPAPVLKSKPPKVDKPAPEATEKSPDQTADSALDEATRLAELKSRRPGISAETLDKLASLTVGSWVDMYQDDSKLRCRLAAILKPAGKYIFVDRAGKKVAESLADELAQRIQDGSISLLDSGLLFDRALESVIGNLRDLKENRQKLSDS